MTADIQYNSSGAVTDQVFYTYDALDRVVIQSEQHGSTWTSTWSIFEGDSTTVARELVYNTQNPTGSPADTENYAYDDSDNLMTLSDTQGSTTSRYSLVTNPQSSVSLLLDMAGNPKQSYGYSAYGQANSTLTQNGSLSASLNPYRFQAKRLDTTFNTYDMGARRYSLTTSRWQQQDMYYDADQNQGLSDDAMTADRYALLDGDPVNYVEADGHNWLKTVWHAIDKHKKAAICIGGYITIGPLGCAAGVGIYASGKEVVFSAQEFAKHSAGIAKWSSRVAQVSAGLAIGSLTIPVLGEALSGLFTTIAVTAGGVNLAAETVELYQKKISAAKYSTNVAVTLGGLAAPAAGRSAEVAAYLTAEVYANPGRDFIYYSVSNKTKHKKTKHK
jgi:RHS repeat-associated protein